jgi:NADH-quinone oxidoreductase subunit L
VFEQQKQLPAARRPDDPVRGFLGPVFRFFERKWMVDELYNAVVVNRYVDLAWFLSDKVDWRFWHDWFHDKVIVGGYNALTHLLAYRVDLGGIDWVSTALGRSTAWLSRTGRRIQTGFVSSYAFTFFIGVVLIVGYFLLRLVVRR